MKKLVELSQDKETLDRMNKRIREILGKEEDEDEEESSNPMD